MNCRESQRHRALATILTLVLVSFFSPCAWSDDPSYKTLYTFVGGATGNMPASGLVMDKFGNLYGTTYVGGGGTCFTLGCGIVYQLVPIKHEQDGVMSPERESAKGAVAWKEVVIHTFNGEDGANPNTGSLLIDKHGDLFGATEFGGSQDCFLGCGLAFLLSREGKNRWTEQVIYPFTSGVGAGQNPNNSLTFDEEGNLYGTTHDYFGFIGEGTVFKLTQQRGGSWTKTVLHGFNTFDGYIPLSGVIFDNEGNLYGTTSSGGQFDVGVVYRLSPNPDGSWTETVLHNFSGGDDGYSPESALIRDADGNLFGVTPQGGANGYGTVYELKRNSDDSWTLSTIYAFRGGEDGAGAVASLVMDKARALYGTTVGGGTYNCGIVFKLTPGMNETWREDVITTFDNKPGCSSWAPLIFDSKGNLYGTTRGDGTTTFGSVFEITPSSVHEQEGPR